MRKFTDLTSQRFGRLTVLQEADYFTKSGKRQNGYLCQCDCGNKKVVSRSALLSGKTRSCGCIIKDFNANRAQFYYPEYHPVNGIKVEQRNRLSNIYRGMKRRCYSPKARNYKNYGGRGITICDEWLSDKSSFMNWAIKNGYEDNLTIDRIDVDGNYEPSNCRWSTVHDQVRNTRRNVHIKFNGDTYVITDLAKTLGIDNKILSVIARHGIDLIKEE